jgi:steroid delta-isomerase-like uncharacterized protein
MPTDTTTPLLQQYYARFNAADWDGMLELLTDDVTHDVNENSSEGGKARFGEFLARMDRCYREHIEEVVILLNADGSRAAVEYIVSGTYQSTDAGLPEARGQTYRLPGGAFFTVRSGKIARITNYYNLQEWLRQIA